MSDDNEIDSIVKAGKSKRRNLLMGLANSQCVTSLRQRADCPMHELRKHKTKQEATHTELLLSLT